MIILTFSSPFSVTKQVGKGYYELIRSSLYFFCDIFILCDFVCYLLTFLIKSWFILLKFVLCYFVVVVVVVVFFFFNKKKGSVAS